MVGPDAGRSLCSLNGFPAPAWMASWFGSVLLFLGIPICFAFLLGSLSSQKKGVAKLRHWLAGSWGFSKRELLERRVSSIKRLVSRSTQCQNGIRPLQPNPKWFSFPFKSTNNGLVPLQINSNMVYFPETRPKKRLPPNETSRNLCWTELASQGPCRGVAPRAVAGIFAGLRASLSSAQCEGGPKGGLEVPREEFSTMVCLVPSHLGVAQT